jgi:hypothetical protein
LLRRRDTKRGNDPLSDRLWKASLGSLAVLAALGAGPAAAQDYSAGKTAAQLFQSDCTACHKSPAGLAKGMDAGSLRSFLKEHYTTKDETAAALASYLSGAGPGDAKQSAPGPAVGPKPKPRGAESEPEEKPAARARATAGPAAKPDGGDDTAIMSEEPSKRPGRATETTRDGEKRSGDAAMARKLEAYGNARGNARATERLRDVSKQVQSYASSGSSTEPGDANAAAARAGDDRRPKQKRRASDKKGGASATAAAAPHASRPRPRADEAKPNADEVKPDDAPASEPAAGSSDQ